jgi:hypothetical protein
VPLITKTVDSFKLSDNLRIENHQLPLQFKLTYGNSYPVCKEYVDMLNAAKYIGFPPCERKILPEFPQFKILEWREITGNAKIQKIMERNMEIYYSSANKLNQNGHLNDLKLLRSYLTKTKAKLMYAKFDIDKDGSAEAIYRRVLRYDTAKDYNNCITQYSYQIEDKKITLENTELFSEKKI